MVMPFLCHRYGSNLNRKQANAAHTRRVMDERGERWNGQDDFLII